MLQNITQCIEATKTSGKKVSHFFKFEKSKCICVFCGHTQQLEQFNEIGTDAFTSNQMSVVGQRS